jgi:hypothetical protein|tara:strand:- start:1377 stop:1667 length:291 start_codon:yes stop_codon:yes gene_type:complete
MLELNTTVKPGICEVHTTEYRGFTSEEIAERAIPKVVSVAEGADPKVKEQAEAFKGRLFHVIVKACNDAIQSDRTTLINLLTQQGHEDMADILRRL